MDYSICPCCNSNDSVQRVGTVIDGGTSHGTTAGASVMFSGQGLGVAPGIYASVNRTALARRLSPVRMAPGNISAFTFFVVYIALTFLSAYVFAATFSP